MPNRRPSPELSFDGGLSTALEEREPTLERGAVDRSTSGRGARGESPRRTARYFAAGARVATTASYQASVEGLVAAG